MDLQKILVVFEDDEKKKKLLDKFKPGFSIRIDGNGQIQTVKASIEKIPYNNIEISKEVKYLENNFFSEDKTNVSLKSKGLTDINISFSQKVFNYFNLELKEDFKNINSETNTSNSKIIHCIHSIYVSLINVTIEEKDIKLKDIIIEKFKDCLAKKELNEKRKKLFELFDLYGMFVPLEFTLGGKYNILFEAKDLKEKEEIINHLNNLTNLSFNSNGLDVKYRNNNSKEFNQEVRNSKYTISLEGGDISLKYDFDEWLNSLNLDNLEIIDFRTLVKIYDFCNDIKNTLDLIFEQDE